MLTYQVPKDACISSAYECNSENCKPSESTTMDVVE
jgi:hypothetical protein